MARKSAAAEAPEANAASTIAPAGSAKNHASAPIEPDATAASEFASADASPHDGSVDALATSPDFASVTSEVAATSAAAMADVMAPSRKATPPPTPIASATTAALNRKAPAVGRSSARRDWAAPPSVSHAVE